MMGIRPLSLRKNDVPRDVAGVDSTAAIPQKKEPAPPQKETECGK